MARFCASCPLMSILAIVPVVIRYQQYHAPLMLHMNGHTIHLSHQSLTVICRQPV